MESDYETINATGIRLGPKIRTSENVTPETIRKAVSSWLEMRTRYTTLRKYFIGKMPIDDIKDDDNPNRNRIIANHCQYIVRAIKGYMVGYPPTYSCAENDTKAEEIIELFEKQVKSRVESQIAQDLSIYGVAYELVYLDNEGVPKSAVFSPLDAFVAYAGDVESDSVFGAIMYEEKDDNNRDLFKIYLYDRREVSVWKSDNRSGPWTKESSQLHGFTKVPLIEYENNNERMGDFEQIISLQNAYNSLISDRMDDKDAFAKSILTIVGHVMGKTPEEVEESVSVLKKHRVLQFDDESGSAAYLEKTMDETGIQVLQDQIKSDIHKFAMVPDLSDEQFANNASGIAMAYKLFGTDQLVAGKISQFMAGFIRRCKLYDIAMHNATLSDDWKTETDIQSMSITFHLNIPQDLSYMATALTTLTGSEIISKQTARDNLMIVPDSEEEAERIRKERDEDDERNKAVFEDDFTNQHKDGPNIGEQNDLTGNEELAEDNTSQ